MENEELVYDCTDCGEPMIDDNECTVCHSPVCETCSSEYEGMCYLCYLLDEVE